MTSSDTTPLWPDWPEEAPNTAQGPEWPQKPSNGPSRPNVEAAIASDGKYQLFKPPAPAVYAAMRADIQRRGMHHPVEVDEDGNILDGHHRAKIAKELGIDCPTVVKQFGSEREKRVHVLASNLLRRQLPEHEWAIGFRNLMAERGTRTGQGARNDQTSATVAEVAAELGVPERTARHRMKMADDYEALPDDLRQRVDSREITVPQAVQAQRQDERDERRAAQLETNKALVAATNGDILASGATFATILVDPPWETQPGDDLLGRAAPTYATLSLDEIAALPVPDVAAQDCHLYLWVTNKTLRYAFAMLEAWGFKCASLITWVKPHFGMGYYFRGQTEHVLFGVKGSQDLKRQDVGTAFHAPRGPDGHSSKPEEFYDLVESCSPGPYLEMFARRARAGWAQWGAEVPT